MIKVRFIEGCYFIDQGKFYNMNDIAYLDEARATRLRKRGTIDILKDEEFVPKEEVRPVELEYEEVNDLSKNTVAELKEIAKDLGLEGYSSMKKQELLDAIEQVR